MVRQTAVLEAGVTRCFGQHPDAEIILSQPGLGVVLGARVLAEFGDDRERFADAKARRNYAGSSPITKASGTRRVVLARYARNKRLADALHQQAFAALTASPGARAYYDSHRARGATHNQSLRALSNRLVGVLAYEGEGMPPELVRCLRRPRHLLMVRHSTSSIKDDCPAG